MTATNPAAGTRAAPDAPEPVISIIIPHLNTPKSLAICLESLIDQKLAAGQMEIIVVDNGSSLPLDPVRARFPMVRFLLEQRPGPGLARNLGVAAARAPLLAFIDADCRALPGWLAAAHDAAASGQIAGGQIAIDVNDPARLTGIEAFESVFGFRQKLYITQKNFSVTANLAMPRTAFDRVGPFGGIDIAEDLDWGRRAHALGLALTYRPDMHVMHPPRPDFAALKRKWDRLVIHAWHEHKASGESLLHWLWLGFKVAGSPFIDAPRIIFAAHLGGAANRLRGLGVLAASRWYRVWRMAMLVGDGTPSAASRWNR